MTGFYEEFNQAPMALSDLARHYAHEAADRLAAARRLIADAESVTFMGMGSSLIAASAVSGRFSGIACRIQDAGEALHYDDRAGRGDVTVLISQSGESAETIRLRQSGKVAGPVIAITNDPGSTLAAAADLVLPLHAGAETSITSKTYSNTLALLHLLASADAQAALEELDQVADLMTRFDHSSVNAAASRLKHAPHIAFVGRGPACATAGQCALSFMEGLRILTSAYTGGAFRHGPFEAAGPDLPVVLAIADGRTRDLSIRLARELARLGSPTIVLTDADTLLQESALQVIAIPKLPGKQSEALFPLVATGAHFPLLHAVALARGIPDPGLRLGNKITASE